MTSSDSPTVVAHRGFAAVHPENTVRAVRESARVADAVEVDLRRCGSGDLVVVHDATVDRTTDGEGRVADLPLSALADLSVEGSGQPVPALADVLRSVPPETELILEFKERDLAADALGAAADAGVDVRAFSFRPEALRAAREAAPDVPRTLLFAEDPAPNLERARELGCDWVGVHHELATAAFVDRAGEASLAVAAWTVPDRETARRVRDAGVDALIVDDPAVAGLD